MENYAAKTVGDLMTYVQEEVIPEIRRLMDLAGKANKANGELNFTLHLDTGKETRWKSCVFPEKAGISNRKNISACCRGLRKHAGGYEWRYE